MAVLAIILTGVSVGLGQAAFSPPAPLRIGVGGDYPDGLDGLLAARGLPHERIFPWELSDPAALKQYEVLLLSCPAPTRGSLDRPLLDWVRAGGRAYIEAWQGMQGPYPLQEFVGNTGAAPLHSDTIITDFAHPLTQGLSPGPIDTFHLQGTFLQLRQPDQGRVLAQYCPDGGGQRYSGGAAVIVLPIGQGEVVYSGSPLSFCCFHRGPTTEPLMRRVIEHLAQGRAVARLTMETPAAPEVGGGLPVSIAQESGKLPPGLTLVEDAGEGAYDVLAQVGPVVKSSAEASVLALDGRFTDDGTPRRSLLWLMIGRDRIELRLGRSAKSAGALASARWQPPASPMALLVRRRPGAVSVVVGERKLLRAPTDVPPGGMIAMSPGAVSLAQVTYQPVEPPIFADDFMRLPSDASPWTTAGGSWSTVGIGDGKQSVNGFYLRGTAADTGLTTVGESWWEDYVASVAARLDGDGACGICALRRGNGEYVAFIADSARQASAAMRLVQVHGPEETVLAQRAGGLEPRQWVRLGLRVREGKIEALLDDKPVLQCANQDPRGGGIGLLVRGGGARFDDVMVQPSSEPPAAPRHEGSPAADLPVSLGPQDTMTWGGTAAPWTASPQRPSLLWHTGDFAAEVTAALRLRQTSEPTLRRIILAPDTASPESEWLAVTATLAPNEPEATVTVTLPGQAPVERRVSLDKPGSLTLSRRGNAVSLLWSGETLVQAECAAPLRCVGLEVGGPPVPIGDIEVSAPQVRDYVFGVAPTEWHVSSGTWEVASRWACDSRWSWFAGWGVGDFAVWNKHRVDGDVVLDYWVGIKMEAPGGSETVRCRDLNATLCGDNANPRSGYSFIMGGDGGVKTQLLRNGVVVAEAQDLRVPAGYGIHHEWFRVRVGRVGHQISMDFEGRPVFRWDDPEPLPGGFVGLWSRDSGILVPRVTIYR